MNELIERLLDEKAKLKKEKHKTFCKSVVDQLLEFSFDIARFHRYENRLWPVDI